MICSPPNPNIAYGAFKGREKDAELLAKGALSDPRSAFLATYALCGFAHVASLAIFVGGTAALVPERTADSFRRGPEGAPGSNTCLPYDSLSCRDFLYRWFYTLG